MLSTLQLSALSLAFALWIYRRWTRSPLVYLPLPPGPKPLPIIGNLLDMPTSFNWEAYHKWAKEFGVYIMHSCFIIDCSITVADSDIIYANAAGTSIVILNSYDAATELLDKRSNIYSDRSVLIAYSLQQLTCVEFGCQ